MIAAIEPKPTIKPLIRCASCDREVVYYNTVLVTPNEPRNICWECTAREEKGFNAERTFSRMSRRGVIPR